MKRLEERELGGWQKYRKKDRKAAAKFWNHLNYLGNETSLCCRANSDMTKSECVRHILIGIGTIAFNAFAVNNPTSVENFISTCQCFDQLRSLLNRTAVLAVYIHLI